jgi:hypothetical protein
MTTFGFSIPVRQQTEKIKKLEIAFKRSAYLDMAKVIRCLNK